MFILNIQNNFKLLSFLSKLFNSKYFFPVWLLILFLIVTTSKLPNIPQRTHDIAAFMTNIQCENCGLGLIANSLIVSPIYLIIWQFFMTTKSFLIIQCVFFVLTLFIFHRIFIKITENEMITSKISFLIISFILFLNFLGGHWSNAAEYLGIGVNLFNYNFSVRSILSLSYFISCYFLIKKKVILSGVFILLCMMSHPTNGFIISLCIVGLLIVNFFKNLDFKKNTSKKMIFFISLGIVPIIIKLATIDYTFANFQIEQVSSSEYINSMYRDEIDDFSTIYMIYSSKILFTLSLLFSTLPIILSYFLRKKLKEIVKIKILSVLIITPILVFLSVLIIEIIFIYTGFFEFFIEKIINSQLGCRVLKYSGIPAMLIWMILASELINIFVSNSRFKFKKINDFFFIICLLSFSTITFFVLKTNNKINHNPIINILSNQNDNFQEYGRMVFYEDLLKAGYDESIVNERFLYDCRCGDIYKNISFIKDHDVNKTMFFNDINLQNDNIDLNFNIKYQNYFSRKKIVSNIRNKLKKGSKLITPPYFYCFREFLPNYDIFFQEHDDGNFMLGSKKIYEFFKPRMNSLLFSYESLPSQTSGLMTTQMRDDWLKLDENDFNNIKIKGFEYILTESTHKMNLKIVHEELNWIIYKIN
jgi:hypothetical protein